MLLYCVPKVIQVGAEFQVRLRIDMDGMKVRQALCLFAFPKALGSSFRGFLQMQPSLGCSVAATLYFLGREEEFGARVDVVGEGDWLQPDPVRLHCNVMHGFEGLKGFCLRELPVTHFTDGGPFELDVCSAASHVLFGVSQVQKLNDMQFPHNFLVSGKQRTLELQAR